MRSGFAVKFTSYVLLYDCILDDLLVGWFLFFCFGYFVFVDLFIYF
jgi:hypothetical protein